jgi:hypothetical protein
VSGRYLLASIRSYIIAAAKFSRVLCGIAFCALALTACSASHQSPLAQLSTTLASLPDVSSQDGVSADPSRGARPALTAAKHELRDWIEGELTGGAYAHAPNIDADAFASLINSQIKAAGINTRPVQMWSNSGVLIAVTSFNIECGSDDSIYGWSWDGKAWRRVITHEITDYAPDRYKPESVYGPENVRFAAADTNGGAELRILVTALNTWCTSGWQGRRFQLYELDRQAGSAALLVDGEVNAFTNEGDQNASLTADRMVIEYTGEDLDPRKFPFGTRASVYALADGKATPVPWAAADAEDFTEQWIAAPWAQSSTVSAPGNRRLEQWHIHLHSLSLRANNGEWTSFADAVRCGDHSDIWEYAIVFGTPRPDGDLIAVGPSTICRHIPGEPPGSCTSVPAPGQLARAKATFIHPSTAYFIVRQIAPNRFSMTNIQVKPRADCPAIGA